MSRQQQMEQNWRQKDGEDFEPWSGWQQLNERGGARRHDGEDYFVVPHFWRYEGDAPPMPAPTVLGYFSVDSEKNIRFDDSKMPVLSTKYIPDGELKVDMDLNTGWHRVNSYTGTTADSFRYLLQWIINNQDKVRAKDNSERLEADFVCSSWVFKKIMQAPYTHPKHNNAEWIMLAKYFKGTIYLTHEVPVEENFRKKEGTSLMEIYGHKFEQYMTGGDPDDVLECNCQFRCVLRLHLNTTSLLYAPGTDGVDPTRHKDDFKDMSSFVRLKVRMDSSNPNADQNYRRHALNNWWIDYKVTGVPRLLVGKRSPEGVVHTLQMLKSDDFPSMAQGEWEPSVCINVLDKFLDFVKRRVVMEPDVVHRFEKSLPALRNIVHTCDPNVTDILPSWYKEELFVPRTR